MHNRSDLEGKLQRTRDLMNGAVDDRLVEGCETVIPSLALPDPDDRHALAAAIVGRADVIVTCNLKDFPADSLAAYNIEAQHPDTFIRHVLDLNVTVALPAVRGQRLSLKSPPKTADEFLDILIRQELPETVAFLRPWADLI